MVAQSRKSGGLSASERRHGDFKEGLKDFGSDDFGDHQREGGGKGQERKRSFARPDGGDRGRQAGRGEGVWLVAA